MAHLRTQERTTITGLPTEILNTIVSLLPRDSHLVEISLVSKQFKDLVEWFRYRSIELILRCAYSGRIQGTSTTGNVDRFFGLVENLTRNPNLRRLVVALELEVLDDSVGKVSIDHDQLITLLPSLKELRLIPPPPHLNVQDSKRLEVLCIDFYDYAKQYGADIPEQDRVDPLEIVARHFWISTLRVLELTTMCLHRARRDHLFHAVRYRTSSITDLRFMLCYDDDLDILPDILLSVRTLKRFIFENEEYWPTDHLEAKCTTPKWFARTLQPHKSTLVDLVIAVRATAAFLWRPLFGSLAGYIHLKRLGIPEKFLVQSTDFTIHELLPPSLEVLQFQFSREDNMNGDEEESLQFERMERLAEHKLTCLPALTRVIWWYELGHKLDGIYLTPNGEPGERWNQQASKFNEVGVKFELSLGHYFENTSLGKDTQC